MTTIITHTADVLDGKPRLEGTRISVLDIHDMVRNAGYGIEETADELGIEPVDVERALEYYDTHSREMTSWEQRKRDVVSQATKRSRT